MLPIVLLQVSSIQTFVGKNIEQALAQKINSKVHIGRVDIRLFNRVIIDDVIIYDQSHRVMLKAGRMSTTIDILPLLKDQSISLSSVQLFATQVHLFKDTPDSPLNCQFMLDSLASKDNTESKLNLHISSLIIRNGFFSYDEVYVPHKKGVFSPSHIDISKLSTNIIIDKITNNDFNIEVKRLSMNEACGIKIKELRANAKYSVQGNRNVISLNDFTLQMPKTEIAIDRLTASYNTTNGEIDKNSIELKTKINARNISASDFHLIPQTESLSRLPLSNLNIGIKINNQTLNARLYANAINSNAFNLNTDVIVEHLFSTPCVNLKINHLSATDNFIKEINAVYTLPDQIVNLGGINLHGNLTACKKTYDINANINTTTSGDADIKAHYEPHENGGSFNAILATSGLNLSNIITQPSIDYIKCKLEIKGDITNSHTLTNLYAKGHIDEISSDKQNYKDIDIDGKYVNNLFNGAVNINDPNIRFSANINGNIQKGSIDDVDGDVTINNLYLAKEDAHINNINLSLNHNDNGKRIISLNSDFANITLEGNIKLSTLPLSLSNLITKRLPQVPGLQKYQPTYNNYSINASIDNTDFIKKITDLPLTLNSPVTIKGYVNDNDQFANITLTAADVTITNKKFENIKLLLWTPNNSINSSLYATLKNDDEAIDIHINCNAEDNKLQSAISWDNNKSNIFRGKLNTNTLFYHTIEGKDAFDVNIPNSHFEIGDTTWTINSNKITYTNGRLDISKLNIGNETQHLYINGIASESTQDSITAELRNINVGYILDLVNFHSVEFDGAASGTLTVNSAFKELNSQAHLEVSDFLFQNGRMGTLYADANYSATSQQINISAVADDKEANAKTFINGYISPQHNNIDLNIKADSTRLEFMQDFCSSFMTDTDLHGNGEVRLCGDFSNLELLGEITANGQLTLTSTNCRYTLLSDTIRLIPGDILFNNVPIKDKYDNIAHVTGGIHHVHLGKMSYDIDATTDKLLVYDFQTLGNSTYCGKAIIKGQVGIHGKGNELYIQANATPLKESYIVYNTTSPDAITSQEFIRWGGINDKKEKIHIEEDSINTNEVKSQDNNINATNQRTNIRMNFMVNVTPDAKLHLIMDAITGDYIDLYGNGGLRISYYNKGAFEIFGNYDIEYGTYRMTIQNLLRRDFTFQNGSIIAFGGDPFEASLRMKAMYQLNSVSLADLNIGTSFKANNVPVNCIMNITGTAGKPLVDFNLDLPSLSNDARQMVYSIINSDESMNQQVLYLLAIGRFYSTSYSETSSEHIGQTSLAMQSFLSGTFSQQLNQVLNQLTHNNNWSFGANIATGTDGLSNAEYEGTLSGRMFNNRLIFNGQFGYRDNILTQNSSFIGDFDIQYLLTPNGNISLKVYNQSNDRYFTKNSLNTQGIGIVFKKEFTLKPLFRTRYNYVKD